MLTLSIDRGLLAPLFLCAAALTAMLPAGAQPSAVSGATNPFESPSALPFGAPPFDRIRESDFRAGFDLAMQRQLSEVAAIATSTQAPSFENTIVALQRSGQMLTRVNNVFSNLTAANTNAEHDALDTQMAPRLAAHQDAIFLDGALYARVAALYAKREQLGLDAESARLLERYRTLFLRAGVAIDPAGQARLRAINAELAQLASRFDQAVLKAGEDGAVVVEQRAQLDGFSADQIAAASLAARARKLPGRWVIPLEKPTSQAALATLSNRALRERLFRAAASRGQGGAADARPIVVQMARLRAEKATLLGYPNWAAYVLQDEGAGTPAAVNQMLGDLARATVANAHTEAAQLQQLIDEECAARGTPRFALQPWDWAYYAERLRKRLFDYDESMVRPYFELEHVLHDGLFYAAHELYGLELRERRDVPVYQADVRVFEVLDADGRPLALLLADFFARANKQGGAWMNEYVSQSRLLGQRPVVAIHINLSKPAPGQPALMSFDDVNGLFHEFGHALHGMFSNVQYPLFAGTNVPLDFVEYPSQFNEMWARNAQVLAHMARHYQSGAPLPPELLRKVLAAAQFNSAFVTGEYLAAAIIDQAWHQIGAGEVPAADAIDDFEAAALRRYGIDFPPVAPRYHSTYFLHVFGGSTGGYSAGYYAYVWSDVLAKDTEHWMDTHGDLQRANGDFLRAKVLARGFSVDPGILFRELYGREPEIEPLLRSRGLLAPQ